MSPCKKLGPLHGYLKWLLRCHIFLLIRGLSLSCNTMFAKSLEFNSTGKLDSPAIFAFRMIEEQPILVTKIWRPLRCEKLARLGIELRPFQLSDLNASFKQSIPPSPRLHSDTKKTKRRSKARTSWETLRLSQPTKWRQVRWKASCGLVCGLRKWISLMFILDMAHWPRRPKERGNKLALAGFTRRSSR